MITINSCNKDYAPLGFRSEKLEDLPEVVQKLTENAHYYKALLQTGCPLEIFFVDSNANPFDEGSLCN